MPPANTLEALAEIPQALAISDDIEIIDIANTSIEQPTRIEPRRNKHGKLRGLAWRERNKGRKAVWYVGAQSEGQRKKQYLELKPEFERANTANGLERGNEPIASVGSVVDRDGSVGNERPGHYIQ